MANGEIRLRRILDIIHKDLNHQRMQQSLLKEPEHTPTCHEVKQADDG